MTDTLRTELYGSDVRLSSRAVALPALLRTQWRVPVVVLIVAACRNRKAKREQIIVVNWALRDPQTHAALMAELERREPVQPAWVRYEPAMVRATNIAHGLGLLERRDDWLALTGDGEHLCSALDEAGLYAAERARLADLPRAVPLNLAQRLLEGTSR